MKIRIIGVVFCGLLVGGCTNLKYPNWEYVRIEEQVPSPSCVYKIQDSCSTEGEDCFEWYKQRATKFNANTVVITGSKDQDRYNRSGWTGNAKGGSYTTSVAEYYYCIGSKNITPVK
ncbi:MAG: hypothetical protein PHG00_10050 [Methylococcales bacterium]|nr:hypothetical protein [Methylococcales bacterium]